MALIKQTGQRLHIGEKGVCFMEKNHISKANIDGHRMVDYLNVGKMVAFLFQGVTFSCRNSAICFSRSYTFFIQTLKNSNEASFI